MLESTITNNTPSKAMISLSPPLSSSSALLSVNGFSSSLSNFKPVYHLPKKKPHHRRNRNGLCRAEFSLDAPFTVAIGACMLSSLVLPVASVPDEDGDSAIDSTDARFAVMGIISFVPYFNWLSWVFAWLDTGKRRYAVYSLVYLAPYLRSNLSLSPEESWLPIASIIFCIVHVQLEASIRNGDIQGFQLFSRLNTRKKHTHLKSHEGILKEGETKIDMKLPSAQEHSEDEIQQRGVPRKPYKDPEHLNENWDDK